MSSNFQWTRKDLLSLYDLEAQEIEFILDTAAEFKKVSARKVKKVPALRGKTVVNFFFEPSTRTRLSFESAMTRLGGQVIGFSDATSSSAAQGESVSDTIRVISCYSDICAMRHPKEGAPMVAAERSDIPVINAGDGGHQHPTQTLTPQPGEEADTRSLPQEQARFGRAGSPERKGTISGSHLRVGRD